MLMHLRRMLVDSRRSIRHLCRHTGVVRPQRVMLPGSFYGHGFTRSPRLRGRSGRAENLALPLDQPPRYVTGQSVVFIARLFMHFPIFALWWVPEQVPIEARSEFKELFETAMKRYSGVCSCTMLVCAALFCDSTTH